MTERPEPAGGDAVEQDTTGLRAPAVGGALAAWVTAVRDCATPALLVDADLLLVAASAPLRRLVGLGSPGCALAHSLHVVDLGWQAPPDEVWGAVPMVRAVRSGTLQRGLLRVRRPYGDAVTLDVVATPLWADDEVAGALAFLSLV